MTPPLKTYETHAGIPTRGSTYAYLLDLLSQLIDRTHYARDPSIPIGTQFTLMTELIDHLIDQSAVLGHLHNTEDALLDKSLARRWLGIAEIFKSIRNVFISIAKSPSPDIRPEAWAQIETQLSTMRHTIEIMARRKMQ
jgi:hypothetical protein